MKSDRPQAFRTAIAWYLLAYVAACLLILALALTLPVVAPRWG